MTSRKAGKNIFEWLGHKDEQYAETARKNFGEDRPLAMLLGGTPLNAGVGDIRADTLGDKALAYGMIGGIYATNVGYRYGLPAAGVTLAGKGLYDLTNGFGTAADQPEQGQLPLS